MGIIKIIEKNMLRMLEKIVPATTLDRLVIERRRRLKVNNVTGYYPHAVFFSKKKAKEKYCVVRYTRPTFALFAAGVQYIFCYHQLIERGYTPLLDMEYAYSYKEGRLGEHNIWDMCFKQTIPVSEVMGKPYVLATGYLFTYSDDPKVCFEINGDERDHHIHVQKENFREYYAKAKKYTEPIWQVKDEILAELDEEVWNNIKGKKVLGVSLRENFSNDVKYKNEEDKKVYERHPLLPSVKETIEIVKEQLKSWECDYIFLATMYEDSVEAFIEAFGDKVIFIKRERLRTDTPEPLSFEMSEKELYETEKENAAFYDQLMINYLKEIIALSRCNYLISGSCSGTVAALTMNGGEYNDIYILEDKRKIKVY